MTAAIYVSLGVAIILIAREWWLRLSRREWVFSLIATTISCLWLCLFLVWRGAIGPDYSKLHAAILIANLSATLTSAVAAGFRSQRSLRTIIAALALAWVWFFALGIMYAV